MAGMRINSIDVKEPAHCCKVRAVWKSLVTSRLQVQKGTRRPAGLAEVASQTLLPVTSVPQV
jgi:hypothetical protein